MLAAIPEEPPSSPETVPAWLLEKTFAVQYNPNCAKPWLVRLVGFEAGALDLADRSKTKDAIGFGHTCEQAALAAQALVDADRAQFRELLRQRNPRMFATAATPA